MSLPEINYDELSPGVRDIVRALREEGFDTCDSGDGSNYAEGMECASPEPMVAIRVDVSNAITEADRLWALLTKNYTLCGWKNFIVQMSYVPADQIAVILVIMERA